MVSAFKNRNFSSPGQGVGSGTKQLHADETFEATAVAFEAAVDGPTQLTAQAAVPVGENEEVGDAVHELQKDSKLSRLAVNCLLKALMQLFPPQLGLQLHLVTLISRGFKIDSRSSWIWWRRSGACRRRLRSSLHDGLTFRFQLRFLNSSLVDHTRIISSCFCDCAQSVCRNS